METLPTAHVRRRLSPRRQVRIVACTVSTFALAGLYVLILVALLGNGRDSDPLL